MSRARITTTVDAALLSDLRRWACDERLPLGVLLDVAMARLTQQRSRVDIGASVARRKAGRPSCTTRFLESAALEAIRQRGGRPLRLAREVPLVRHRVGVDICVDDLARLSTQYLAAFLETLPIETVAALLRVLALDGSGEQLATRLTAALPANRRDEAARVPALRPSEASVHLTAVRNALEAWLEAPSNR